jgi:hypothetical protein
VPQENVQVVSTPVRPPPPPADEAACSGAGQPQGRDVFDFVDSAEVEGHNRVLVGDKRARVAVVDKPIRQVKRKK